MEFLLLYSKCIHMSELLFRLPAEGIVIVSNSIQYCRVPGVDRTGRLGSNRHNGQTLSLQDMTIATQSHFFPP